MTSAIPVQCFTNSAIKLIVWELVTRWVRDVAVDGEECKGINERSYILNAEKI